MFRSWEYRLRQTIFRHEHISDDCPITDSFDIGWAIRLGDWGLAETQHRTTARGSYRWDAPIKTAEDLKKLRPRTVEVDRAQTARLASLAHEPLGDIRLADIARALIQRETTWAALPATHPLPAHMRRLKQQRPKNQATAPTPVERVGDSTFRAERRGNYIIRAFVLPVFPATRALSRGRCEPVHSPTQCALEGVPGGHSRA